MWTELQQQFANKAGIKLFTVMRYDGQKGCARRFYSSDPEHYPTFGTKPVSANRWQDIVLKNKNTFLGNTLAELDAVFPDGALIGSLGLGSCANVPVVENGEVLGTLNLLREEGGLSEEVMQTLGTIIEAHHDQLIEELKKEAL